MDMLRLRILTMTAAICLAVYFYSQPVPMLNVVAWNAFFIALNLVQIFRILLARCWSHRRQRRASREESVSKTPP
jgi:hypothetical protein